MDNETLKEFEKLFVHKGEDGDDDPQQWGWTLRGAPIEVEAWIKQLLDQQKQELLDAMTLEKDGGVIFVPEPEISQAYAAGYKLAYDKLEATKQKILRPND